VQRDGLRRAVLGGGEDAAPELGAGGVAGDVGEAGDAQGVERRGEGVVGVEPEAAKQQGAGGPQRLAEQRRMRVYPRREARGTDGLVRAARHQHRRAGRIRHGAR
jgi:hypothetical protein